jgi:hypothetical protein
MVTTQYDTPLTRVQAQQIDLHLVPGVANRLIAEMALRDISQHHQVHYLSQITGRALQTVARWIDPDKPGMPDLRSLALLSIQFGVDANWLLGLSAHRTPFRNDLLPSPLAKQLLAKHAQPGDWLGALLELSSPYQKYSVATMRGQDMAPIIVDGSPFFFDANVTRVESNGIYYLQYRGQKIVRHVEIRIGKGFLLRCENSQCEPTTVPDISCAPELRVLGRVTMAINACRL